MSAPLSEEPRTATTDERLMAREVGALLQRAAGEASVSALLLARMWEFTAFPLVDRFMIEKLRNRKAVAA